LGGNPLAEQPPGNSGNERACRAGNYGYRGKRRLKHPDHHVYNEVYAQAECTITVIPRSFFKWNYRQDGWKDLPALNNAIVGASSETLVRSGETAVIADKARGGLILEGPGALIIGSVMTSPTNSPFPSDPRYDRGGAFNFFEGPSKAYTLWNKRARISVDYEIPAEVYGMPPLRIQINNNTLERDNAAAIDNWLAAELKPNDPRSGILTGVFNAGASALVSVTGGPDSGLALDEILSSSFVCLALPEGKILIRGIRIESAD